ncbi:YajG family lipoprotein [Vibrio sp. SCSIO 43137]|uniref:YajG family lipoprotein n=1 Tax=Vibrio sp. SCSIO 43137 TaxID=3021011 RepID=UPI0023077464|nr:YajG family lipoprotein [Vibrio sp. SCSIO 43137]WCE29077.1 YajG family lipoprotein [Vibrio sp. SCSIO 43137]
MKKLILAASVVLLAACSSSPQEPQVNFMPQITTSQNRVVDNLTLSLDSRDARSAQYVALVDSGRNNILPIHAKQNVRITLESALNDQLNAQGYRISVNSPNTLALEIRELLINVRHSVMSNEMEAKVTLQLTAETPAGKLVKTYNGSASKSGTFSASDAQIEEVLNDITSLVLKEIANDPELNNYMKERF